MRLTARRSVATLLAGTALVLSSAAACGPTGDDDTPGVVQDEGDGDGNDGNGDDGNGDEDEDD